MKKIYLLFIVLLLSSCCSIVTLFKSQVIVKFSEDEINRIVKDSIVGKEFKVGNDIYTITYFKVKLLEGTNRAQLSLTVDCNLDRKPDVVAHIIGTTTINYFPDDNCKVGLANLKIESVECEKWGVDELCPDWIAERVFKRNLKSIEKACRKDYDVNFCDCYSLTKIECKDKIAYIYFDKR